MGRQKRSENTYTKINTIFYRDESNIIMPYDELVMPELEWLRNCKFDATEKIDGTNIRIEVTLTPEHDNVSYTGVSCTVDYKGKTDNAQVPKMLMNHLVKTYPVDKVLNALGLKEFIPESEWAEHKWTDVNVIPKRYTLYGEGYGVKIQGCGGNYLSKSNAFIGFDVKVDDMYLLRDNMLDIFNKLGCPTVPYVGKFTIDEAIEYVKNGFKSTISENKEFLAEGLVLKTPNELTTRRGDRICFKVKTCDWVKYKVKYGTLDRVEQKRNPKAN